MLATAPWGLLRRFTRRHICLETAWATRSTSALIQVNGCFGFNTELFPPILMGQKFPEKDSLVLCEAVAMSFGRKYFAHLIFCRHTFACVFIQVPESLTTLTRMMAALAQSPNTTRSTCRLVVAVAIRCSSTARSYLLHRRHRHQRIRQKIHQLSLPRSQRQFHRQNLPHLRQRLVSLRDIRQYIPPINQPLNLLASLQGSRR